MTEIKEEYGLLLTCRDVRLLIPGLETILAMGDWTLSFFYWDDWRYLIAVYLSVMIKNYFANKNKELSSLLIHIIKIKDR